MYEVLILNYDGIVGYSYEIVSASKCVMMCESMNGPLCVFFFFWHYLKNSIAKVTQNTTNPGEAAPPKWKIRNDAHMRSIHDWSIVTIKIMIPILVGCS